MQNMWSKTEEVKGERDKSTVIADDFHIQWIEQLEKKSAKMKISTVLST